MWISQNHTKPLLCTWAVLTNYTFTFILLVLSTISKVEWFDLNSRLSLKTRWKKTNANVSGCSKMWNIYTACHYSVPYKIGSNQLQCWRLCAGRGGRAMGTQGPTHPRQVVSSYPWWLWSLQWCKCIIHCGWLDTDEEELKNGRIFLVSCLFDN